MVAFLIQLLCAIRSRFSRRARFEAENLLLRQQLVVLRRKSPTRVRLWNIDRLLLVWLYRLYPSLLDAIIIVQPETVIRWHRRGFRAYWRWKSCHVGGRPRTDSGIRALIRRMNRENPLWGAPRIHGELLMLGSKSLNQPSASIWFGAADHRLRVGRLFYVIMPLASLRWICSSCARSRSSCSMVGDPASRPQAASEDQCDF
jgi:hypothetical protein